MAAEIYRQFQENLVPGHGVESSDDDSTVSQP